MRQLLIIALAAIIIAVGTTTTPTTAHPIPAGTAATRGIRNLALVYLDSRASMSVDTAGWNTLVHTIGFDAIQILGYKWKDGSCFWPGSCKRPMNLTDWEGIFDLWMVQNVPVLQKAAAAAAKKTKLVIAVPYPDTRQQSFGVVDGRNLNFSKSADRQAAVEFWVNNVTRYFLTENAKQLSAIDFAGFYWFYEEMTWHDIPVTRAAGSAAHKSNLTLSWIPYYNAAIRTPGVEGWRLFGFDFVSVQPNYAFNDVGVVRFEQVNTLIDKANAGVEMELPLYSRNAQIHDNATRSFYNYIEAVKQYHWQGVFKSYYYGQAFIEMARSGNTTELGMFKALCELVKSV